MIREHILPPTRERLQEGIQLWQASSGLAARRPLLAGQLRPITVDDYLGSVPAEEEQEIQARQERRAIARQAQVARRERIALRLQNRSAEEKAADEAIAAEYKEREQEIEQERRREAA
jgi:hypothetical protein